MAFQLAVTLSLVALLGACGSRTARHDREPSQVRGRPAIVLIPGFYGTALADRHTGEKYFLTAWQAVFGSTPLALIEPDLGVAGARDLVPAGVLENVRIIPGAFSKDVYGEALDFLRDEFGEQAEIVAFDYDWRRDLRESVQRLHATVENLHGQGASSVSLVAHSMGGLIAAYYARYGTGEPPGTPPRLAAVAIVGTPFLGAMTAFRNLQIGTSLGPAKKPLAQESLATFPAMYHLMAEPSAGFYRDKNFRPLAHMANDFALWKQQGLGLFRPPLTQNLALRDRRADAQKRYLERAAAFRRALFAPSQGTAKLPMLFVVGTGRSSFTNAVWTGDSLTDPGRWLFADETVRKTLPHLGAVSLQGDGDGTVPTVSAQPPPAFVQRYAPRVITTPAHHEEMFVDAGVREAVAGLLRQHAAMARR